MKCSVISDLHIVDNNDSRAKLLRKFCANKKVLDSDLVFFQGDIFEAVIGDHKQYLHEFEFFFKSVLELTQNKTQVVFIEGNHDFHFKKIFERYLKENGGMLSNFKYLKTAEEVELNNRKYLFCHGYEVDYHNKYFKRWYNIYTSTYIYILATYILPYRLIKWISHWASADSKKRGRKTFDYAKMKKKYIDGANKLIREKNIDGVIAGHTHILESHQYDDGTVYYNCGYPDQDKQFIYFDGSKFTLENI